MSQKWVTVAIASLTSAALTSVVWNTAALAQSSSSTLELFRDTNYILGAGDSVALVVFGFDEYTGTYIVRNDGTISLPIIGSVVVAGHTIDSLTAVLRTELNEYLVEPSVVVDLITQRPITVLVSGEVHRPGLIELEDATTPSILTALSAVGGITRQADIREVTLRREASNGEVVTITLDLWELLWQGNEQLQDEPRNRLADLVLRDDDEIFIPQLSPTDVSVDRRLLAQSTFAPETVKVRVVGEVNNPGEVEVTPNSSLSSAVAIAGGPTTDAALHRVEFIRLNEQGVVESQEIDLRNLIDNIQVQEGDVIIVPERNSSSLVDWATRVLNPLGAAINIIDRIVSPF